jgi:hypothetical protein
MGSACAFAFVDPGSNAVHGVASDIVACYEPRADVLAECGGVESNPRVPLSWKQSCAWVGCGANQAQAPAVGDCAAQHGYESALGARNEPRGTLTGSQNVFERSEAQ